MGDIMQTPDAVFPTRGDEPPPSIGARIFALYFYARGDEPLTMFKTLFHCWCSPPVGMNRTANWPVRQMFQVFPAREG